MIFDAGGKRENRIPESELILKLTHAHNSMVQTNEPSGKAKCKRGRMNEIYEFMEKTREKTRIKMTAAERVRKYWLRFKAVRKINDQKIPVRQERIW